RGVRIATALALRTQGGIALAESDVPVVWAYEGRGVRALVLAFDLAQSDLPLHPAFPVLVANAIDWLGGGSQARLGEAPLVPAGIWKQAILRRPDGGAVTIEARDGAFALPVLDRIGDYHLRTEGWERRWVVSTVEAHESSLDPDPPASTSAAPSVPQMAQISLVPWLLGAAALLLAGEWWLWARTLPVRQRDGGAR
ncbi:MAG: hypothetical protein HY355_03510, partial [Armatimonadetes bacterium]|nr:hypothetical protein [Armatimonadota bacterium]